MDLEFHQLDLRYEPLRRRVPGREKRLLASLMQWGQQAPIVVVNDADLLVVVDGYKRIRALRRLKADTVSATTWTLPEPDALVLQHLMRASGSVDAFEQAWLRELQVRFALSAEELAQRFNRSKSWVSRRIALVEQLPDQIQARVRDGHVVPYAAMKFLVPLARANRAASIKLVAALGQNRPSTRQMASLYGAWLAGDEQVRERIISEPWLFLRALEESQRGEKADRPPVQQLLTDLDGIGALSRRASARIRDGLALRLSVHERREVTSCLAQTRAEALATFAALDEALS